MRIFKTRVMARFCKSEAISDQQLAEAIARAERGLVDATLGAGLIKQRVARPGQGKSGGWRTLVAYSKGHRAVFLTAFAKSDMENITPTLAATLKIAARDVLSLSVDELAMRLRTEQLTEVACGKKN